MFKSIKYLLLLAFMASFVSFSGALADNNGHNGNHGNNGNCDYDDQGDFNEDDDCGTAAATCEWTFELLCPAEITCEDADLGTYCIGETIDPTGDESWVYFYIGGEAGRSFALSVDVSENAVNEDDNADPNVVVDGLEWEFSNNGGTSYNTAEDLGMDGEGVESEDFYIPTSDEYAEGSCVGAEESGYVIRVRPTSITTTDATMAGVYTVLISLGVDFGYSF